MNPSEYADSTKFNSREAFGSFVKARRQELGMSVRQLAQKLDFTPAYISDIEKGNRNAPINHLPAFQKALQIPEEQTDAFVDLASVYSNNWPDLNEYLGENPGARKFVRFARDRNMTGEEFMQAVDQIIAESQNIEPENE